MAVPERAEGAVIDGQDGCRGGAGATPVPRRGPAASRATPAAPGVAAVDRLLTAMSGAVAAGPPGPGRSGEFAATVLDELSRRYRRALRAHARGAPLSEAWRVVLDADAARPRVALAALTALVDHDLPVAVVSAGTLLDHHPGEHERRRVAVLARLLVDPAHERACPGAAAGCAPDDGARSWAQAQRLWALRGQPAAAAAERSALDRRVAAHGRAVLAGGTC
ncbi:MAG TPA: DUF5995 family protein [Pseudonocardia sp.]|nr:DUF5995 family protein [Pseudonocardia sp.]